MWLRQAGRKRIERVPKLHKRFGRMSRPAIVRQGRAKSGRKVFAKRLGFEATRSRIEVALDGADGT